MSAVALDEFKRYLQIDTSDTSQDTLLGELLDRAEKKIAQMFGGALASTEYTERYDFEKILFLNHYPIISVSSLIVDSNALTEDTDFYVYDTHIVFANEWSDTPKNVQITYTAGFATVPDDLKNAIILTAANYVKLNTELKPEQKVDWRIPQEVENILNAYRRFDL